MSQENELTPAAESDRGNNLRSGLGNGSERAYLSAIVLPPVLLMLLFVYGQLRESFAAAANAAEIAEIQDNGGPVDNHTLTQWFDRRTSKSHSQQWSEVLLGTRGVGDRFGLLASHWVVDFGRLVAPGQPWEAEPIASRYAEESQPVFAAIEKLVADPNPVWQPLFCEGQMTMLGELQESRAVVRLLANEFRVAAHQDDQPRAIRAVRLTRGVADAFDWNVGVVSDLVAFQHRDTYRELIRESLRFEFWTLPHLGQLKQQLSKRDAVDIRWRDSQASERAMTLAELSEDPESWGITRASNVNVFPFGVPATTVARFLEVMRESESAGHPGTSGHARLVKDSIKDDLGVESNASFTITGIPLATAENAISMIYPAMGRAANAYVRNEQRRRWTLTAVAIKEFRLQEERWPASLNELTSTGLSGADWMATENHAFGYQIDKETDQAILWTETPVGFPYDEGLLHQPPSLYESDPERLREWEVRISP